MGLDFDVAIVGAGIAGGALAHALAPQARVLLLEREPQPGVHSTGRSAAMFMESYGPPQARALTRASRAFYTAPPEGFADAPILSPRGALYVAWTAHAAALDSTEAGLRATGTVIERLGPAEALARMPLLREHTADHGALLGALWEPDAMDVDVHALHQGYLRGARRQGAALWCDAELQQATRTPEGWTLTLADGRTLRAERLVNAAGAWADVVAERCGSTPQGLQPKRRSAFTFDAPADHDCRGWPVTAAIDERWYVKPDAGQLLGSPANADPVAPHDVVAEELDIATAIHHIGEDTALQIRHPRRTWAGLRTFSRSGELVIGSDANGLFWLAGQGGYGIQSAQGAAMLAAALLRGVAPNDALRAQGVQAAAMAPLG
ncbi:NAD(P)/FAD-dependent oxidoreductase [Rubrivivax albus]|uniref:FAD-binding oxidoreductase n=1 Tax=Rubrivivax albus TaxID=2499835 RepID=A0A437K0H2_9BURK|nr:FAD-dependent oxidoreductase [Rubrivivax albus]RVT53781.1 FAD-binding oxidoreductase [Rubrivivax albus]